jgi:DNA-binding NarL/FixJ family response regulator
VDSALVPTEIVGRDASLADIAAFAARLTAGPCGLLLRGEPGIGKSTLWTAACDELRARGHLVLGSRPAEAEVRFAFAGLRDLVAPVADRISSLPAPMARALRVALLLEEPGEEPIESGAVEAATLALVRELSAAKPLALAVDDVQWLDDASRTALSYVARRLRNEPIGFVAAERVEREPAGPSWLVEAIGPDVVTELWLRPLSVGALHHLLQGRLGLALPRPLLVRLHELSGGNPFYALELGAARQAAPDSSTSLLPVGLRELVARRLRALPARTRALLLAAAVASGEMVGVGRLATVFEMEPDVVRRRLAPAVAAAVITEVADRVRFSHPLLAAAAVDDAPDDQVRRVHERLAATGNSVEARARHLSFARAAPDRSVATALDLAAASASSRGAAVDAAELRALAVRFSEPDDPAHPARLVDEAEARFIAGDIIGARTVLEAQGAGLEDRQLAVRAYLLLATITWYETSTDVAVPIGERALELAGDDPELRARVHARMAWLCDNDIALAQRHAAAALQLIDRDREPALYAFALLNDAYLRLLLGIAADREAVDRGWELQESARMWEFSTLGGNWPKLVDDFDTARDRLATYLERVRAQGDESSISQLAGYLAELECWTGNVEAARAYAAEAIELAEESDQRSYLVQGLRHMALVEVIGGSVGAARPLADRAVATAEELGDANVVAGAYSTRALVALTDGDHALVDRLCTLATERLDGIGMRDHAPYRYHADHIEALIALGDLDRAQRLLERHATRGHLGPRPWILATAARCEGLIRSARGDAEGAAHSLAEAHARHAAVDMPFERARTLLVEGQVARRANHRREAVEALGVAIDIFERLGSVEWTARARADLGRVGIRRGRGDDLTPTELSVARLAARGLTNREMAAELYISPKTVEANLSRAYAKLGIRSRAELGAVMAERSREQTGEGEPET